MITLKQGLGMIFLTVSLTTLALFTLIKIDNAADQRVFSAAPPLLPSASPTVIIESIVQEEIWDSSDGTKSLIMKKQQVKDLVKYSFFISDKSDSPQQLIFKKNEPVSYNISIPYNSWSPDNNYVFLKEETSEKKQLLCFLYFG